MCIAYRVSISAETASSSEVARGRRISSTAAPIVAHVTRLGNKPPRKRISLRSPAILNSVAIAQIGANAVRPSYAARSAAEAGSKERNGANDRLAISRMSLFVGRGLPGAECTAGVTVPYLREKTAANSNGREDRRRDHAFYMINLDSTTGSRRG